MLDRFNDCIQKFTSSGAFITKWGSGGSGDGEFKDPFGIAIDGAGNVYVADTYNDRIQKFNPDGGFITKFGAFGTEPGLLSDPTGLAVNSTGKIYVADTLNNRIQVLKPSTVTTVSKAIIVGRKWALREQHTMGCYPTVC